MDIFFSDPTEIPLPPEEVRIRELQAEPWPDGRRVRVYLEVDPSQKRPSADLVIKNENGEELASASIIENVLRKMEVTMHLRGETLAGSYSLTATLFFASVEEPDSEANPPSVSRQVVDTAHVEFSLIPTQSSPPKSE